MPMARVLVCGLCLALSMSAAFAGAKPPAMVLYRYLDSRGVKVLDSQGVPPEYAGKGYEILNQQGRVIQVVPPAPTAEELKRTEAQQAQAEANAQLLKKYPNLTEVDRAKERKMAELDGAIVVARNSQQALLMQQQMLQSQAAEQERAGHAVSPTTLDEIKQIRSQRDDLEAKVHAYQQARSQADKDFADLKARLAPLLAP